MAQHSQISESSDSRRVLEAQLRECFGRVVYTHKTHEKCADLLLERLSRIKLLQIVLSALTTGGFVSVLLGAGKVGGAVGAVISTVLLFLTSYMKNYDLGSLAQEHRQTAAKLWFIRERYFALLTDLVMGETPVQLLQERRDEILDNLQATYGNAPSTTFRAYRRAQEALKKYEDMTFSDAEIDAFLPAELKRNNVAKSS